MFWTRDLPEDAFADEPVPLAEARAALCAATARVAVTSPGVCDTLLGLHPDWQILGCGDSLPNTHWQLMCRDGIWAALRVDQIIVGADGTRFGAWQDLGDAEAVRRDHLHGAVARSPFAASLPGLIDELVRHARGLGPVDNDYPYGEIHALQMALGVPGPAGDEVRFLASLTGFPAARALIEARGLSFEPRRATANLRRLRTGRRLAVSTARAARHQPAR